MTDTMTAEDRRAWEKAQLGREHSTRCFPSPSERAAFFAGPWRQIMRAGRRTRDRLRERLASGERRDFERGELLFTEYALLALEFWRDTTDREVGFSGLAKAAVDDAMSEG